MTTIQEQQYRCGECGWIGTEKEMEADYFQIDEDSEAWCNWICPGCEKWYWGLNEYYKHDPNQPNTTDKA